MKFSIRRYGGPLLAGAGAGRFDQQTLHSGRAATAPVALPWAGAPRRKGRGRTGLILIAMAAPLGGCATAGSTLGGGVLDRAVPVPPYYAGSGSLPAPARIAHLPVSYQRGAREAAIFEPVATTEGAVAVLLRDLNLTLDRMRVANPIDMHPDVRAVAPDVMFGCDSGSSFDCEYDGTSGSGARPPPMWIAVSRPSPQWVRAVSAALRGRPEDHVLMITLEIGEYWAHQKNRQGAKEVKLGTGHFQKLPWLTSLDQPVQVLQLTGALVDSEGRAVRIGAEGLVAKRTHLLLSAFGVQEMVSDDDVEQLATMRRDDLAGSPLVWEVALSNLVRQLTGDGVMR